MAGFCKNGLYSRKASKKHNLSFLLSQMKNMVNIPEKYYDYSDVLTPYGVVVRYPYEIRIEEHNVIEAIQYAGEIVGWAEGVVTAKQENIDEK